MRARARERWVLTGVHRPDDHPQIAAVYSAAESRVEWLLAVMCLLGWWRSEET